MAFSRRCTSCWAGKTTAGGRGWLPHLAAMPKSWGELPRAAVPAAWRLLLGRDLIPDRGKSRTWRFDDQARQIFHNQRAAWKIQAGGIETASTAAALGKADIHLWRVALVLAEADQPGKGGLIVGELVRRAIRIVQFTLDCWRALPEQGTLALSRRDETLDRGITRLIAWLDEHGGKATRRELQRAHVAGVRTAADLDALLERYEAAYPGSVTTMEPDQGGLPTVVVKAPRRRAIESAIVTVSPNGDTGVSATERPHEHGGIGGVATGDTDSGDTESGDTALRARQQRFECHCAAGGELEDNGHCTRCEGWRA
jgi:hypothetical protein